MKKQKVSLKKLSLSKSKVAQLSTKTIVGGASLFCLTDNGCGPEMSVWPDICPISHNCPPATNDCTMYCESFACGSFACGSVLCITVKLC